MRIPLLVVVALGVSACSHLPTRAGDEEEGQASYYDPTYAGRPTASGERYVPTAPTCAHRTLPFGSWVEVERLDTHQRVRLRVNDRGPFKRGRIVDVSNDAARSLGLLGVGVAPVRLRVISVGRGGS